MGYFDNYSNATAPVEVIMTESDRSTYRPEVIKHHLKTLIILFIYWF